MSELRRARSRSSLLGLGSQKANKFASHIGYHYINNSILPVIVLTTAVNYSHKGKLSVLLVVTPPRDPVSENT